MLEFGAVEFKAFRCETPRSCSSVLGARHPLSISEFIGVQRRQTTCEIKEDTHEARGYFFWFHVVSSGSL